MPGISKAFLDVVISYHIQRDPCSSVFSAKCTNRLHKKNWTPITLQLFLYFFYTCKPVPAFMQGIISGKMFSCLLRKGCFLIHCPLFHSDCHYKCLFYRLLLIVRVSKLNCSHSSCQGSELHPSGSGSQSAWLPRHSERLGWCHPAARHSQQRLGAHRAAARTAPRCSWLGAQPWLR